MNETGMGSNAPQGSNPSNPTSAAAAAQQGAGQVLDSVRSSLDDVKGTVKESANTLMQGLSSAAADAKSHAGELAGEAKSRVYGIVDQQKNVGAEQIGGIAQAVHSAADDLEKRAPAVARYVHDAASGIDRVSEGLKNSSVDDIIDSVEHFARTQPMAFFGVAALAGFALSRFVKSSSDRRAARIAADPSPAYRPASAAPPRSSGAGSVSSAIDRPIASTSPQTTEASAGVRTPTSTGPAGGVARTDHDAGSVTSRGAEPSKGFDPKRI